MKTSELPNKIIKTCITELNCWIDSNDIDSPTHVVDAQFELDQFYYDDELPPEACDEINEALQELRYTILKVTHKE